jgi:CBS domain containing-hemolysin-like protein
MMRPFKAWASPIAITVCSLLTAAVSGWLLLKCVVRPWHNLVMHQDLIPWILGTAAAVFLCSCSEIAISETHDPDIESWLAKKTKKATKATKFAKLVETCLRTVTLNHYVFNTLVILANTLFWVAMTILVTRLLDAKYVGEVSFEIPFWGSFTMSSADAFSTVGSTLILFGAAEVVPKQIAISLRVHALIAMLWWIVILLPLFPFAYGVARPMKSLMRRFER